MVTAGRKQIAIVGGGFAAMAAAWDLTSPGNPESCDVTIFQIGGRLGGKGASSRNPEFGHRIEEHGLHLWLGYYENAFRMIRTCFEELQTPAPPDPELTPHLASAPFDNWNWLAAFERANLVGLADYSSGEWTQWIARFPEYVLRAESGVTGIYELPDGTAAPGVVLVDDPKRAYPGEPPVVLHGDECPDGEDVCLEPPNVAFFLTHALRELQAFVESLQLRIDQVYFEKGGNPLTDDPEELLSHALTLNPVTRADAVDVLITDVPRALRLIRLTFLVPAGQACATLARLLDGPVPHVRGQVVTLLDNFIDEMREKIETFVQRDPPARRIWELIDLIAANIRGLVVSGLEGSDDFSSLDEYNYADWLRTNGVADRTLKNPIARGAHDLGFAYADGDPRNPQIAAGQALDAACRFFFMYKGALFWRMKAGMGDVVFAPLYLALRRRGVKFRFFHRLDDIDLAADGTVSRLRFWRQVTLRNSDPDAATNYKPLMVVPNQDMSGWRARPDSSQFDYDQRTMDEYECAVSGADPRAYMNFESIWCNWPHGRPVYATVGESRSHDDEADPDWVGHYDDVIVTVPIAALGRVSTQLAAAPDEAGQRWREMLEHIATVATQTAQLWVRKTSRELGWPHGQVCYSAFVHPFDTWADLSPLVHVENQPDARGVHYFCSVLPARFLPPIDADPAQIAETLRDVTAAVRENVRRFLNDWVLHLWPDAVHRYPNVFKWELLVGNAGQAGARRLESQHIVANVDPSERYTQSLPGTTKYRIRPDDSGFGHLYIAGDWTDCGYNVGCVEAAVISGRLASAGLTGFPDPREIPGHRRPIVRRRRRERDR